MECDLVGSGVALCRPNGPPVRGRVQMPDSETSFTSRGKGKGRLGVVGGSDHPSCPARDKNMQKNHRGFTLIELMLVVAVIGILASIAVPSYQRYVQASKVSAVQQFMLGIASMQEQYRMEYRSYVIGSSALAKLKLNDDYASNATVRDNYDISLEALPGQEETTYVIVATPKSTGSMAGTDTLRLTSTGAKAPVDLWK